MSLLRTAFVVAVLMTTTSAAQTEFKSWPLSQSARGTAEPISRADLVVVAMQDAVLRELNDALARRGQQPPSTSATWTRRSQLSAWAGKRGLRPVARATDSATPTHRG